MKEIVEGVFLSSYLSAKNEHLLDLLEIKCVLTVAKELKGFNVEKESRRHLFFPFEDNEEQLLIHKFPQIVQIIDECVSKKEKVLVHWLTTFSKHFRKLSFHASLIKKVLRAFLGVHLS